jgi:hypothetical protein
MKRRAVPLGKVPLVEAKASIAPAEQTEYNTEVPDYGGDVSDEGTGAPSPQSVRTERRASTR